MRRSLRVIGQTTIAMIARYSAAEMTTSAGRRPACSLAEPAGRDRPIAMSPPQRVVDPHRHACVSACPLRRQGCMLRPMPSIRHRCDAMSLAMRHRTIRPPTCPSPRRLRLQSRFDLQPADPPAGTRECCGMRRSIASRVAVTLTSTSEPGFRPQHPQLASARRTAHAVAPFAQPWPSSLTAPDIQCISERLVRLTSPRRRGRSPRCRCATPRPGRAAASG